MISGLQPHALPAVIFQGYGVKAVCWLSGKGFGYRLTLINGMEVQIQSLGTLTSLSSLPIGRESSARHGFLYS